MTSFNPNDVITTDSPIAHWDFNIGKGHGSVHSTCPNSILQRNTVEDSQPAKGDTHPDSLLSGNRKTEFKVLSSKPSARCLPSSCVPPLSPERDLCKPYQQVPCPVTRAFSPQWVLQRGYKGRQAGRTGMCAQAPSLPGPLGSCMAHIVTTTSTDARSGSVSSLCP